MSMIETPASTVQVCQYQLGALLCRGAGVLWKGHEIAYDLDGRLLPCPACNTVKFLESAKEDAETVLEWCEGGWKGTGVDIWLGAVAMAFWSNPSEAEKALEQVGPVEALVPDNNNAGGISVRLFNSN